MLLAACGHSGPPYSAENEIKTFQLEAGFRVEPFLSEPDIHSPVAMEIDENGRMYVVEDPGYPLDTEDKLGQVILFEDTNGDGRPDRRTVFVDGLIMPTGVMCWKKGILVTDAPNVWYFEDTNGDGKADVKRVVLTGFAVTNPQHTVNNPVYGLDNWIYLAHEGPATAIVFAKKFGDRGSEIRFPDDPNSPRLEASQRHAIRFRPDTHQLEALAGSTQFGQAFDEWGHHFTLNNTYHIRHEVIADRYLERNRDLLVPTAMQEMSDHGIPSPVYPITRNPRFELLTDAGQFTSACGLTCYLGGAFSASLGEFSLVAEPAHNLVHRDIWSKSGPTFIAHRAQDRVEFLASTDAWFRPVNFYIGPDGAIYMLDFYRLVIEHPEWMATDTYHSKDLYQGQDRGRIYRITPDAGLAFPRNIHLGQASDEELVAQLANPNIWWRRTAQRLLVDRHSDASVEPLVHLFETTSSPVARVHALWTLDGLGKLDPKLIEKALADPEPGVRENAILLAEPRLKQAPALVEKLVKLQSDPDGRVQFQLLCTLGSVDSPASRAAQNKLLAEHIDDRWMQIAALSASSDRAPQLFAEAVARRDGVTATKTDGRETFFREVAGVIGERQKPAEIRRVLQAVAGASRTDSTWWRVASLNGLALGLRAKKMQDNVGQDLLLKLFEGSDPDVRRASLHLLGVVGLPQGPAVAAAVQRAAAVAVNREADAALRADSLDLLALAGPAPHEAMFKSLVDPQQPEAVQAAAVRALGRVPGDEVGSFFIERWRSMTSTVRNDAAAGMLHEPARVKMLVAAMKNDQIQAWTLGPRYKHQLIMYRDPEVREMARPLLEAKSGEREKVLKRYEAALAMEGNPGRGQQVFRRVCSKCHKLDGFGAEVGPDLGTIRNRPAELILPDIILPSRSITQGYESYVVETKSGGTIEGVMGPQTPTTITIRHEEGKQDVIRRDDIRQMYATNLSAMPDDLDKQVSVEQMADLLKFLKSGR